MDSKTDEILFQEILKLKRKVRQNPQTYKPETYSINQNQEKIDERPIPRKRERILRLLLSRENGLRQKKLCEMIGIGAPAMSETIERLEFDGYIERIPDSDDKRATRIHLTAKGKARAYEIQEEHEEHVNKLFQNLREDEKLQLMDLLKKIND